MPEVPADPLQSTVARLLETAARLHEAALDPARWPEVIRAARLRLSVDRATGALSPEHAAWLESIMESATRVCAEVARLELARAMAGSATDMLPIGLVLLDARGRLLRANPEAGRLLRSIGRDGPHLSEPTDGATRVFFDLPELAGLVGAAVHHAGALPLAALLSRSGKRPIEALAVPVSPAPDALTFPEARTMVFLLDPDRLAATDETTLAIAFQLTPAEARLAARLLRGDTLKEAAGVLGIKTTTARTHLARLFGKTGTSRQPELVKLLVLTSLSAPMRPADGSDSSAS